MTQKTKCRFGFHDWNQWKKTRIMEVSYHKYGFVSETLPAVTTEKQELERTCQCCGLFQRKLL